MKFRFIEEHRSQWPVSVQCRVLQVSRSGYYAWRKRPPSPRAQRRQQLAEEIQTVHQESRETYGSPRVHRELQARGIPCCVNTVAQLMKEHQMQAKTHRKFCVTTDSHHNRPVAENVLDRQFQASRPHEVWLSDLTYIPTQEGWLYLAVVEDLYSRKIVGWSMGKRLTSQLVTEAKLAQVWWALVKGENGWGEFAVVGAGRRSLAH